MAAQKKKLIKGELVSINKNGKPRKPRTTEPTEKQAMALDLILQGKSKRQAMIAAGYTPTQAAQPSNALLSSKGAQQIMQAHRAEFIKRGINPDMIGKKMKEWLDANKVTVDKNGDEHESPDYITQLAAYREYKKDLGIHQPNVLQQTNNQYNIGNLMDEFAAEGEVVDASDS